jgi:hypothetical protein
VRKRAKKTGNGVRRRRSRSVARKITIVIEARKSDDGSDVSTTTRGKAINRIFDNGGEDWTWIKGAVHQVIAVIGLSRHGRDVTITSEP